MWYVKVVDERRIFWDIVNEKYDFFELEYVGVYYNIKMFLDFMKYDLGKVFDVFVVRCFKFCFMYVFFVKVVVSMLFL